MYLKKALLHIYGVRSIYSIMNVCMIRLVSRIGKYNAMHYSVYTVSTSIKNPIALATKHTKIS